MIKLTQALTLVFSVSVSTALFGHHSSAPHFDSSREIILEGYVTELKFVNPHAYLYFDVEQSGESVNWRCELSAATQLLRNGWSADMFAEGQKLTINGSPARREDNVCYLNSLTLEDGTEIGRYTDLTTLKQELADAAELKRAERPNYLDDGQPNIQGSWISKSFGRDGMGIKTEYTATEAGKEAAKDYEMAFDDPILKCHIVNIFDGWNHDSNINEITQTEDTITLQYGFMDFVRTIHLNMEEHPENIEPSAGGHSIGRWEGDTLVVDTVGFDAGVLSHRSGTKHSDQMHSVERFYYDEENEYLVRDYTVTDPLYLVGETQGQDFMAISDVPYSPYNCVELSGDNNIRPSELTEPDQSDAETPAQPERETTKPWWQFWDS